MQFINITCQNSTRIKIINLTQVSCLIYTPELTGGMVKLASGETFNLDKQALATLIDLLHPHLKSQKL